MKGTTRHRTALAILTASLLTALMPRPGTAQYAVDPGEAIAAGPLQIMSTPSAGAAKVMELEAGRTVTVLGYPRGTGMAWIAVNGRELGYVSAASLAPIDRERPILYRAAVIAQGRTGAAKLGLNGQLDPAGEVVDVVRVVNGKASLDGSRTREVPADQLVPILGTYGPLDGLSPGAPGFFAARLGRFATPAEAQARWAEIQQYLPELAGLAPYLFRRATTRDMAIELAAGPFNRMRVEEVCTLLARRGQDCWPIAVDVR